MSKITKATLAAIEAATVAAIAEFNAIARRQDNVDEDVTMSVPGVITTKSIIKIPMSVKQFGK